MGRRSINTTKSGKYMNPTDQARKEARKKELKKNKRQRQMVRAAVLKNKDPGQILEEMEKIDEMEYNVMQPSPLNEKVLRDKRKKLKETFDRVMRLYHNDEPEHWAELKRKEVEYEKKRLKKQQYYESVKHAQSVQIDDIPLPTQANAVSGGVGGAVSFPGLPVRLPPPPTSLSLPPFAPSAPPGTLKKTNENLSKTRSTDTRSDGKKKDPPGVPPGPPPNLDEMPDLDSDVDEADIVLKEYNPKARVSRKDVPKPNSLQQRMLAISGQNIDEFMKEMENVHKKKEKERENTKKPKTQTDSENSESDTSSRRSRNSSDSSDSDTGSSGNRVRKTATTTAIAAAAAPIISIAMPPISATASAPASTLPPATQPPHIMLPAPPMPPPLAAIPPPMLFRPPPLRQPGNMPAAYGIRMAPGPPHAPRPPMQSRLGIRMPPGPPPGMPPRMAHHQMQHKTQQQQQAAQLKDTKGVTTITAKPQIRNLSADVTRFVPSTLRVKREEVRKPNRIKQFSHDTNKPAAESNKTVTKDDAYMQFMNEMQGLL